MKFVHLGRIVRLGLGTAFACGIAVSAQAAPMSFDNISAVDAANQLSQKYGINIVFKGDFGGPKYVTFSLTDADAPGARLQAINALANAVGADFTKTYVVSTVPDGQDVPTVKVDSNAPVVFNSLTLPTRQAINLVAGVDNATAQIADDVTGNVTLSDSQLSDSDAATAIATQSHTRWKVFYAMTSRAQGHQLGGVVIDHTNGGSPITELPYLHFQHRPTVAEQQAAAQQQAAADEVDAQQQALAQQQAMAQAAGGGYNPNGYYNPYGYGSYGSPYGSGGYNYNDPYGGYGGANDGFGSGGNRSDGTSTVGNGVIEQNGNTGFGDGTIVFGGGDY